MVAGCMYSFFLSWLLACGLGSGGGGLGMMRVLRLASVFDRGRLCVVIRIVYLASKVFLLFGTTNFECRDAESDRCVVVSLRTLLTYCRARALYSRARYNDMSPGI